MTSAAAPPTRRALFGPRYSLRLLLVAFTAFAIGLPVWYRWPYTEEEIDYAQRQGQTVKSLPPTKRTVTTWQRQWGGGRSKSGMTWIYLNGDLTYRITYRNGVSHGPYCWYHRGARVECDYVEGEVNGELREFQDDVLQSVTNYRNGRKEGPYQRFVGGRLAEIGQFVDNLEAGTWKRFDKDGRELWRVTHRGDAPHRIQEVTQDRSLVDRRD